MSLADQIIEQGPFVPGDVMPFPTAPNGHPTITAAEINELRAELITWRNLRSRLARFELDINFWDDEANLRCDSCGATWDFGNDRTLAELVQRATDHTEVCR